MTEEEFLLAVGYLPTTADLERANCQVAGVIGHQDCGVCKPHGKPIFACRECFKLPLDQRVRK